MKARATGGFASESWDELPYGEIEGAPRISRVSAIESFRGDIEGRGTQELLVFYDGETSGSYIGMERIDGRLGGRSGSFVLRHSGTFADGEVDYDALGRIIEFQIKNGTQGLVPCGTTGESPTLTRAEHLRVVGIALEEAGARSPCWPAPAATTPAR